MNRSQRYVVSIALGAVCVVAAVAITSVWPTASTGGWFMYAPDSQTEFVVPIERGRVIRQIVVWFVAIAVWTGVSWRLFRTRPDAEPTDGPHRLDPPTG